MVTVDLRTSDGNADDVLPPCLPEGYFVFSAKTVVSNELVPPLTQMTLCWSFLISNEYPCLEIPFRQQKLKLGGPVHQPATDNVDKNELQKVNVKNEVY